MRKLLSANFARLRQEKTFWLALAFLAVGGVCFSWMSYNTAAAKSVAEQIYTEDMMFNLLPLLGFVCCFFISMRLGAEFDEHTLRNKLIVGHTRAQVYFAEYVTCLIGSLALLLTTLFFAGVSGYGFFRTFLLGWEQIAFLVLCCVLMTAVFSAMGVGFGMNVRGRAYALVASIVFLLIILCISSFCEGALSEPPTTYDYVAVSMDGVEFGDLVDNPAYVSGTRRTVYELITDLLPTGQVIQLNNLELERASRWPALSFIMLLVSTAAGYLPFRKKDIP